MSREAHARGRRLTLRDLAKHADVSPATVSLVLRKSPLVAASTRDRVLAAIDALGYVYNRGAASLRTRRTHTVGVAMNELVNPYFSVLTAAIERALTDVGHTVFLSNSDENPVNQHRFVETMREYNPDGLVICPAEGTDPAELSAQVRAAGIPCVLISRNLPGSGLDFVGNNHRPGLQRATESFIELGHRRIAHIGGSRRTSTGTERYQGYLDGLAARGIAPDPDLFLSVAPTRSGGVEALRQLLALPDPPTAAVCFNDVIAFGVMLGLRQMGMEPGCDFAISGCDDIPEAELWTPALTTIRVDAKAMGETAAKLLLERIEDPAAPPRTEILGAELIVRESSGGVVRPAKKPSANVA